MPEMDYIFRYHYLSSHGPISVDPNQEHEMIKVPEDGINFTLARVEKIKKERGRNDLNFEAVSEVLSSLLPIESLEISAEDNAIKYRRAGKRLSFYIYPQYINYYYVLHPCPLHRPPVRFSFWLH